MATIEWDHVAPSERRMRQKNAYKWVTQTFGSDHANNLPQRALRFLEEAIELYQAVGASKNQAHKLIDYIFAKPAGVIEQELGGAGLTLLALAAAAGLDADSCEQQEFVRVLSKPAETWAKRNQQKNEAGFDAKVYPVDCVRELGGCGR
jgi:hypothetical protein